MVFCAQVIKSLWEITRLVGSLWLIWACDNKILMSLIVCTLLKCIRTLFVVILSRLLEWRVRTFLEVGPLSVSVRKSKSRRIVTSTERTCSLDLPLCRLILLLRFRVCKKHRSMLVTVTILSGWLTVATLTNDLRGKGSRCVLASPCWSATARPTTTSPRTRSSRRTTSALSTKSWPTRSPLWTRHRTWHWKEMEILLLMCQLASRMIKMCGPSKRLPMPHLTARLKSCRNSRLMTYSLTWANTSKKISQLMLFALVLQLSTPTVSMLKTLDGQWSTWATTFQRRKPTKLWTTLTRAAADVSALKTSSKPCAESNLIEIWRASRHCPRSPGPINNKQRKRWWCEHVCEREACQRARAKFEVIDYSVKTCFESTHLFL